MAKTREEIKERVISVASELLGVEEAKISGESRFYDDLGADSLDSVELIMALEDEFDCEIVDEEAEKITTIDEAVNTIEGKQSAE